MHRSPHLPQIWAHRGASAARPENTLEAFREAARMGADGVELDVRRSRDHAMAVHHDPMLADGRTICELDVGDLPRGVPLLGAAIDACEGMTVNIEIKNVPVDPDHDPGEYLAEAVAGLVVDRSLQDRVVVSSFSLDAIDRVRATDRDIPTGYLASPRWDQLNSLQRAIDHGHAAFHPFDAAVGPDLVRRAHDHGLAVNVWTVDDPDRVRWLAQIGVDAIITNVPDVAIEALQRG